jgi:hypothetical protein
MIDLKKIKIISIKLLLFYNNKNFKITKKMYIIHVIK